MEQWLIGAAASLAAAFLAYRLHALSASGAPAAFAVGVLFYGFGSLPWFGVLLAFFISSSLLSKWKKRRKAAAESGYEKGSRRDAGQVFANGGIAAVVCIVYHFWEISALWAFFIGVMASVNADTWATEIGSMSRTLPLSIRTGKRVKAGTSGGITGLGVAATALGGAFIGLCAWGLTLAGRSPFSGGTASWDWFMYLSIGLLAGIAGSIADSLIGAFLQRMHRCSVCGQEVEKMRHCGVKAVPLRGWSWMNNDAVNALSSIIGGAVAILASLIWLR